MTHINNDCEAETLASPVQCSILNPFVESEPLATPSKPRETLDVEAAPTERSGLRLAAIVIAIYLSTFVFALDATIIATCLPTIAHDLNAGSSYSWIGSSYLLAAAAAGPLWSNWSNIWGRKPAVMITLAIFFFSSIVCALATSAGMLIAGRVLQGLGGGGIGTLVCILISDIFSMRRRTLFLGLMEIMWGIAAGTGPILGGTITEKLSWRWIFWINLPISGLAFILALVFLNVHNPRTTARDGLRAIDWWGGLSITGLTVMLLVGLNFGGTVFPWSSPVVICLMVFGLAMTASFIVSEKWFASYPILPLSIYRDFSNAASLIGTMAHSIVVLLCGFYIPLFLQSVRLATPIQSGILLIPFELSQAAIALSVGVIMNYTGVTVEIIWASTLLMTAGSGALINWGVDSSLAKIIGYQILVGSGSGGLFQPYIIAVQSRVEQDDQAAATAALNFARMVAGALALVLGGVVFENGMLSKKSFLLNAGLSPNLTADFTGLGSVINVGAIGLIEDPLERAAVQAAYAASLRNVWVLMVAFAATALAATLFVKKSVLTDEHKETVTGLKKKPVDAK